jgi:tRNA U54 and U55 pseudouridine synthase Pus10
MQQHKPANQEKGCAVNTKNQYVFEYFHIRHPPSSVMQTRTLFIVYAYYNSKRNLPQTNPLRFSKEAPGATLV